MIKILNSRYKLINPITGGLSNTLKGKYRDMTNKNYVFIKQGNFNNLKYEYMAQKEVYYASYKNIIKFINIPMPYRLVEKDNFGYLITEYLDSTYNIKDIRTAQLARYYLNIIKFLRSLKLQSKFIKIKSPIRQVVALPYFVLKNIYYYPKELSLFIKSFFYILLRLNKILYLPFDILNHGDINLSNIFLSKKKVYLLDFSEVRYSHKFYDLSRSVNSFFKDSEFYNIYKKLIRKHFKLSMKEQRTLKIFIMFNLHERLSQRYDNKIQSIFYIRRLKKLNK